MKFLEHFGLKNPADLPPLPEQPAPPNAQPRLVDAAQAGGA
jgi:hypothetical protein